MVRLRAVASLAEDPEFHISRVLEPGDLEIIHNPTIFHARSDIHDGEARSHASHSGPGSIIRIACGLYTANDQICCAIECYRSAVRCHQLNVLQLGFLVCLLTVLLLVCSAGSPNVSTAVQGNDEKRHLLRWWVHTDDNPRPVR